MRCIYIYIYIYKYSITYTPVPLYWMSYIPRSLTQFDGQDYKINSKLGVEFASNPDDDLLLAKPNCR